MYIRSTQLFLLLVSVQSKNKPELSSAPPELDGDAEKTTRQVEGHQPDVVFDESGRSLAVTLHEVCSFCIVGQVHMPSYGHVSTLHAAK